MNYNKIVFLILLSLISVHLEAQNNSDHLEPVSGIFGDYDFAFDYHTKIRKVLLKDLSDSPDLRFITLPSFSPEYVLDLNYDKKKEEIYLIFRVCKSKIWYNKNWEKIKVLEYKKKIDKEQYDLIMPLFQNALNGTRYAEEETIGFDGTDYYFIVFDNGIKAGKIWTPNEKSKMGRLVEIGNELIKFTRNKVKFDKNLKDKIELLNKELN
ncbi:hypothetical protein ACFQ3Q_10165 [Salegentibacter chungangensis]|uniref:DUF4136 domain-containing protein n=2 Tax=Salegentibacter chungangensis TaxID=1335724 RepID=A0ABW3NTG5_9FLAO